MATIDSQHRPQLNGMQYEHHLRYASSPHFNDPWVTAPPASSPLYTSAQAPTSALEATPQLQQRPASVTLPPYNALPITTTALPAGHSLMPTAYPNQPNLQPQQDLMSGRSYPHYQPATSAGYHPSGGPGFALELPDARAGYTYAQHGPRRPSHPFDNATQAQRDGFGEVIDASKCIISLSQSDITPTQRNMYGDQSNRNSSDSYGFPPTHSAHSSISSASGIHSNYGSSVGDYPLTDYSSASESVELNNRTLPRPNATTIISNSVPPAAQAMMGQFSSKVSSTSQKKHKCKVCDKRFTRPSSLQTHIYSHTGEKPFACDVDGCGRHFSVVSNLRRHRKVHKNKSEAGENSEANDTAESQGAQTPEEV